MCENANQSNCRWHIVDLKEGSSCEVIDRSGSKIVKSIGPRITLKKLPDERMKADPPNEKTEKTMVNATENEETKNKDEKETPIKSSEKIRSPAKVQKRILARRNTTVGVIQTSYEEQQQPPVVQCKLPLDRITAILTKFRKQDDSSSSDETSPAKTTPPSSSSPPRIMCLFCDRTFTSGVLLQKHTERSHHISSNRRASARNIEQTPSVDCFFHPGCNLCNKNNGVQTANDLPALFNHLLNMHAFKYFACRTCKIRFSTRVALLTHNSETHDLKTTEEQITAAIITQNPSIDEKTSPKSKTTDCKSVSVANTRQGISKDPLSKRVIIDMSKSNCYPMKQRNSSDEIVKENIVVNLSTPHNDNDANRLDGSSNSSSERPLLEEVRKSTRSRENSSNIRLNTKTDSSDTQILSRLGLAQNRTPRARSLRRSRKPTVNEIRALSEVSRKEKVKAKPESTEFFINKNRNDPSAQFDPDFYSTVSSNVRENLLKYLDGKLGRGEAHDEVPNIIDPKVKSTHAIMSQTATAQPAELHSSDVTLNAITIFPTLLTSDQYGSDKIPHYSYGANIQSFKKIITKNSWKWKWDPIKKYKYCNEDGKIVRKIRPMQHISPRDLSKLDIWTQLTMREKYDSIIGVSTALAETTDTSKLERQRQINELNTILDKRVFPEIEKENARFEQISDESDENEINVLKAEFVFISKIEPEKDKKVENCESDEPSELLQSLGLFQKSKSAQSVVAPVLSGEWARPRCYVCYVCGRVTDCLRLLEAHQAIHHPHVHATHYELVGQELLDDELYKHLYIPGCKVPGENNKSHSSDAIAHQFKKRLIMNRSTRILRTATRTIKAMEKECTKCKKRLSPNELHRHILECAGDYGWIMAKKKCKYKPFGARRRRLKGLYKRERPVDDNNDNNSKDNNRPSRPKIPSRPRTKNSDADSIQRMLENLPAKRASRQVLELPLPKVKNHLSNEEKSNSRVLRFIPSKNSVSRSKLISARVITTLKDGLSKKVCRVTRSIASNLQSLRQKQLLKRNSKESNSNNIIPTSVTRFTARKQPLKDNSDDKPPENKSEELNNSDKNSNHQSEEYQSNSSLEVKQPVSRTVRSRIISAVFTSTDSSKKSILEEEIPKIEPPQRKNRISKNISAVATDNPSNSPRREASPKSIRRLRRPVISSKIIETCIPVRTRLVTKGRLSRQSNALSKVEETETTLEKTPDPNNSESNPVETEKNKQAIKETIIEKPKSKKNSKKSIFPLKWIGNKKIRVRRNQPKNTESTSVSEVNSTIDNSVKPPEPKLDVPDLQISEVSSSLISDQKEASESDCSLEVSTSDIKDIVSEAPTELQRKNFTAPPLIETENSSEVTESGLDCSLNDIDMASRTNRNSTNFSSFKNNNSQRRSSSESRNLQSAESKSKSKVEEMIESKIVNIYNDHPSYNHRGNYASSSRASEPPTYIEPVRIIHHEYDANVNNIDKPPLYDFHHYYTYPTQAAMYGLGPSSVPALNAYNSGLALMPMQLPMPGPGQLPIPISMPSPMRPPASMRLPASMRPPPQMRPSTQMPPPSSIPVKVLPPPPPIPPRAAPRVAPPPPPRPPMQAVPPPLHQIQPKPPKNKRGLNDCIAMLKDKLSEKPDINIDPLPLPLMTGASSSILTSEIFIPSMLPPTRHTGIEIRHVQNPYEEIILPLDLSGRMPEAEDLSLKSIKKEIIPKPSVSSTTKITIVNSGNARRPVFDPTLRIPQYPPAQLCATMSTPPAITQQIATPVMVTSPIITPSLKESSSESNQPVTNEPPPRRPKTDFTISALVIPDRKLMPPPPPPLPLLQPIISLDAYQNITAVLGAGFSKLPHSLIATLEKLPLHKRDGLMRALPQYLASVVDSLQLMRPPNRSRNAIIYSNHYYDPLFSHMIMMKTTETNLETTSTQPKTNEISTQTPSQDRELIENVPDFNNVDTDLFLIDPVTGLITERSSLEDSTEKPVVKTCESKTSQTDGSIIDIGDIKEHIVVVNTLTSLEVPSKPLDNKKKSRKSSTEKIIDGATASLRAVRIRSSCGRKTSVDFVQPDVIKNVINDADEIILPRGENTCTLSHDDFVFIQQDEVSSTEAASAFDKGIQCIPPITHTQASPSTLNNKNSKRTIDKMKIPKINKIKEKTPPKKSIRNLKKKINDRKIEDVKVVPEVMPQIITPTKSTRSRKGKTQVPSTIDNIVSFANIPKPNQLVTKQTEGEILQKSSFSQLLMEENNSISETALTPSNVIDFKPNENELEKCSVNVPNKPSDINLDEKQESIVRRSLRKNKSKQSSKITEKAFQNLENTENSNDICLNPDMTGAAIIPGELYKANLGKTDIVEYPITSNNMRQEIKIHSNASDNDESDDDVCLALVAKKKLVAPKKKTGKFEIPLSKKQRKNRTKGKMNLKNKTKRHHSPVEIHIVEMADSTVNDFNDKLTNEDRAPPVSLYEGIIPNPILEPLPIIRVNSLSELDSKINKKTRKIIKTAAENKTAIKVEFKSPSNAELSNKQRNIISENINIDEIKDVFERDLESIENIPDVNELIKENERLIEVIEQNIENIYKTDPTENIVNDKEILPIKKGRKSAKKNAENSVTENQEINEAFFSKSNVTPESTEVIVKKIKTTEKTFNIKNKNITPIESQIFNKTIVSENEIEEESAFLKKDAITKKCKGKKSKVTSIEKIKQPPQEILTELESPEKKNKDQKFSLPEINTQITDENQPKTRTSNRTSKVFKLTQIFPKKDNNTVEDLFDDKNELSSSSANLSVNEPHSSNMSPVKRRNNKPTPNEPIPTKNENIIEENTKIVETPKKTNKQAKNIETKIVSINSVELSENGHLIFKMQKDVSKKTPITTETTDDEFPSLKSKKKSSKRKSKKHSTQDNLSINIDNSITPSKPLPSTSNNDDLSVPFNDPYSPSEIDKIVEPHLFLSDKNKKSSTYNVHKEQASNIIDSELSSSFQSSTSVEIADGKKSKKSKRFLDKQNLKDIDNEVNSSECSTPCHKKKSFFDTNYIKDSESTQGDTSDTDALEIRELSDKIKKSQIKVNKLLMADAEHKNKSAHKSKDKKSKFHEVNLNPSDAALKQNIIIKVKGKSLTVEKKYITKSSNDSLSNITTDDDIDIPLSLFSRKHRSNKGEKSSSVEKQIPTQPTPINDCQLSNYIVGSNEINIIKEPIVLNDVAVEDDPNQTNTLPNIDNAPKIEELQKSLLKQPNENILDELKTSESDDQKITKRNMKRKYKVLEQKSSTFAKTTVGTAESSEDNPAKPTEKFPTSTEKINKDDKDKEKKRKSTPDDNDDDNDDSSPNKLNISQFELITPIKPPIEVIPKSKNIKKKRSDVNTSIFDEDSDLNELPNSPKIKKSTYEISIDNILKDNKRKRGKDRCSGIDSATESENDREKKLSPRPKSVGNKIKANEKTPFKQPLNSLNDCKDNLPPPLAPGLEDNTPPKGKKRRKIMKDNDSENSNIVEESLLSPKPSTIYQVDSLNQDVEMKEINNISSSNCDVSKPVCNSSPNYDISKPGCSKDMPNHCNQTKIPQKDTNTNVSNVVKINKDRNLRSVSPRPIFQLGAIPPPQIQLDPILAPEVVAQNEDRVANEQKLAEKEVMADANKPEDDSKLKDDKLKRRSNVLATKKIFESFDVDSSDTDFLENKTNRKSRPQKRRHRKSEEQSNDLPPLDQTPSTSKKRMNKKIGKKTQKEPDTDMSCDDTVVKKGKKNIHSDTYCLICRRKFRRPENLFKHNMTLIHISKLSEIEAKEMEKKQKDAEQKSYTEDENKSDKEPAKKTPKQAEKRAIKAAEKKTSKVADKKKCKSIVKRPMKESQNQMLISPEPKLSDMEVETSIPPPPPSIAIPSTSGTQRPKSSRGYKSLAERKSFDSSNVKPESPKKVMDEDDYESETDIEPKRKELSRDEALFYECCSLLKESDIVRHERSSMAAHQSSIDNKPSEYDLTYNYPIRQIILEEQVDKSLKTLNETISLLQQKSPEYFSAPTPSTSYSSDLLDNTSFNNNIHLEIKSKKSNKSDKYNKDSRDTSIESDRMKDNNNKSDDLYSAEALIVRNNSDDFSDNGDSIVSTLDTVVQTVDSKQSTSRSEICNPLLEFEDKFDKIKRKAREKAQAANEAMAAVINPKKSQRKTQKSRKSTKSDKGDDSSDAKPSKRGQKNHLVDQNNTALPVENLQSQKVLTKGALKGFDGVKILIPTRETTPLTTPPFEESQTFPSTSRQEPVNRTPKQPKNKSLQNPKNGSPKSSKPPPPPIEVAQSPPHKISDDSEDKHLDIYEFYDDDEDDDSASERFKFRSPIVNNSRDKDSSSKKSVDSFITCVSNFDKQPNGLNNEDSQISSLSFSDRDDFAYMSEEEYIQNSHTEEETNMSSSFHPKKNRKGPKDKENTKKNVIMGKIFKNNAIRNESKNSKEDNDEQHVSDTINNNQTNMDQLFDSLLEETSSNREKRATDNSTQNISQINENDIVSDTLQDMDIEDNAQLSDDSPTELSEEFESDEEEVQAQLQAQKRKIVPRLKATLSDDTPIKPKPTCSTSYKKKSKKHSNKIVDNSDYKEKGIANRKSQRKCTTGKQNILVESWSSESDFEDFRQFEEYSSVPKHRSHRRPRRSGRHRVLDNHKVVDQNHVKKHQVREKKQIQSSDSTDDYVQKVEKVKKAERVKKNKNKKPKPAPPPAPTPISIPSTSAFILPSTSTSPPNDDANSNKNNTGDPNKPTKLQDNAKKPPSSSSSTKRVQRSMSGMLYYWPTSSSDSEDRLPRPQPPPAPVASTSTEEPREPEPVEQHGWIVGDSHKKLVTMLAHAKGRKLDDGKDKKSRPT